MVHLFGGNILCEEDEDLERAKRVLTDPLRALVAWTWMDDTGGLAAWHCVCRSPQV
jgi:hypothetical protein